MQPRQEALVETYFFFIQILEAFDLNSCCIQHLLQFIQSRINCCYNTCLMIELMSFKTTVVL